MHKTEKLKNKGFHSLERQKRFTTTSLIIFCEGHRLLSVIHESFILWCSGQMGVSEGKAVGEWFGPNTVAQVLRKLAVYDHALAVHICMDNTLIVDDVLKTCRHLPACPPDTTNPWRPLLLIVPLRLGLSSLNPCYKQAIKVTAIKSYFDCL